MTPWQDRKNTERGDRSPLADIVDAERRRGVGRLAGVLFCAGAAVALPSILTLRPMPPSWVLVLVALSFGAGVASLVLPWDRLPAAALHILPLAGTALITAGILGTGTGGSHYAWLFVLTVVLVACAFRSPGQVAAYALLVSAGSAAPLLEPGVDAGETLRTLLVSVPCLVITAGAVFYLRERLEAKHSAYERLAQLDPLTGVGNYRTLFERLAYEIARHERHGRRFAVMLVDLNRFKEINDHHGHLEGDRVLRDVGRALAETVRDEDTVVRQGGDEFSVLAPETSRAEMMALARRVQVALATIDIGERSLTASLGWAIYPDEGESAEALLARADSALMAGKARWLPEQPKDYWPEHLRRLQEPHGGLGSQAGDAGAAS